ncbi:hypothetical protein R5R35_012659 [Gryllus longicercus]|uniref:Uncharacterized protein n=1 Tax=Gryllus longicercus TaxID=2509291 RepID=A0AAN9V6T3_9ORTH
MDKPGGRHYRYEQYHPQSQLAKNNNQKTASLKRGASGAVDGAGAGAGGGGGGPRALGDAAAAAASEGRDGRCLCVPGGKGPSSEGLVQGIFCNLAICALLLLYTLLGSVALLWLEQQQRYHHTAPGVGASLLDAASTRRAANGSAAAVAGAGAGAASGGGGALAPAPSSSSSSAAAAAAAWAKQIDKERSETVEKIWDITVSLNILYRENWTLLAAKEIARFQDEVVLRLHEEMKLQQQQQAAAAAAGAGAGAASAHDRRALAPYEWNFPRAFLYSLTVLTTIGECPSRLSLRRAMLRHFFFPL